MKIMFLTNNLNKIIEYKSLLPNNFTINTLKEENIIYDPIENGSSFVENLNIKLNGINEQEIKKYDYIIAEDSGLCIKSLNGEPGIYSKRYSGNGDDENNKLVIKNLKGIDNREAYYYAIIGFKNLKTKEIKYFEGKCQGDIAQKIHKSNIGFAYDYIFQPYGYNLTFSQLNEEVKNSISHRKKAIKELIKYIEGE